MNKYGQALRTQREISGHNQSELARAIGTSQQNINRWEKDEAVPGIDFFIKLAQFYNITIEELLGLSDFQTTLPIHTKPDKSPKALSDFDNEYVDILSDNNFIQTAKLYKAIKPELRALAFGYLVGMLQSQGVNTQQILK